MHVIDKGLIGASEKFIRRLVQKKGLAYVSDAVSKAGYVEGKPRALWLRKAHSLSYPVFESTDIGKVALAYSGFAEHFNLHSSSFARLVLDFTPFPKEVYAQAAMEKLATEVQVYFDKHVSSANISSESIDCGMCVAAFDAELDEFRMYLRMKGSTTAHDLKKLNEMEELRKRMEK